MNAPDPRWTDSELRRAAADWTAGDLDPAQAEAVERLAASDPTIAEEAEFWRRLRAAMPEAGRPEVRLLPGSGTAEAVRRRARREQDAHRRFRLLAGAGWLAAAVVLIALLLPGRSQPISFDPGLVYAEDGTAVAVPLGLPTVYANERFLPRREVARLNHSEKPLVCGPNVERAWLGIWTKPVDLIGFDRPRGLLVARVAGGSPAADAGLRPGDVVLDLAGCAVVSPACVRGTLGKLAAGAPIELRWWRPADGQEHRGTTTLKACLE